MVYRNRQRLPVLLSARSCGSSRYESSALLVACSPPTGVRLQGEAGLLRAVKSTGLEQYVVRGECTGDRAATLVQVYQSILAYLVRLRWALFCQQRYGTAAGVPLE